MGAADNENVIAKFFLPYVGELTIRRTNLSYTGGPAWGDDVPGDDQWREYEDCLLVQGPQGRNPWMPAITREGFVKGMSEMPARRRTEAEAFEKVDEEEGND